VRRVLTVCVLILFLAGCSKSPVDMRGSWSVTATNRANGNFTFVHTMNVRQSGTTLSGSAYIDGYYFGTVSGSVDGNKFSMRVNVSSSYGGGHFNYSGSAGADTFSGSYTASGGGYGPISGNRMSSASLGASEAQGGEAQGVIERLREAD
jgi:hypothetical protein